MAPSAKHLAQDERHRLCDTLQRVGPDEPTLCSPWSTRDLAVHLAFRDRLLDVSPTHLIALARGKASKAAYASVEWPDLVELVRSGPPRLTPAGVPAVDELMNTQEFFIHHEDILRASPGWSARAVSPELEDRIWGQVGLFARVGLRSAPVGIRLEAPGREPKVAKKATARGMVTVKGAPSELVLYASGRQRVAEVALDGDPAAAAALAGFGKR